MSMWQLNRRLLYFKVWGREFPLHSQIIEMPIFLDCGIIKMLCYYKLLLLLSKILPKYPERCSCTLFEGLPHLLIPFCLKIFSVDVVCRSLQAALVHADRVTLNWSGKKLEGAQIMPPFLSSVLQLLSIISPETTPETELEFSSPFTFFPVGAQGFHLHWELGSGSGLWTGASTGSILRPV